jgi:protein SCO1/2
VVSTRKRATVFLKVILSLAALSLGLWFGLNIDSKPSASAPRANGAVFESPRPLTAFTLHDHLGASFDLRRLTDHWTFLYFGYAHCPDLCPTTLAALSVAKHVLTRESPQTPTQFVFISVDPDRDTRERLRNYVTFFDSSLIGVTGTPDNLKALSAQFGASYRLPKDREKGYAVDHTDVILIVSPKPAFAAVLTPPHDGTRIAKDFRGVVAWNEAKD